MKLTITIKQGTKKSRVIVTDIPDISRTIIHLRKIWEVEQALNNLPGSNIRWHFHVE